MDYRDNPHHRVLHHIKWCIFTPADWCNFSPALTDLRMITIDGDSLDPLLASGDRILVDTSQRVPVPPGVFVIWDGLGLVAKRVERDRTQRT